MHRMVTSITVAVVSVIVASQSGCSDPRVAEQVARETAAVRMIRSIHQAETEYYSQFGRFAASMAELGSPASGAAGPAAADLLPKDFSEGKKGGYVFTVAATPTGYTVNANPKAFNSSGRPTFFSDQTFVIRNNWTQEPANATNADIQ